MKLKSIALALSFATVFSAVANTEEVTVTVDGTTVQVKETTDNDTTKVTVSVSATEQEATKAVAVQEETPVSTEEAKS